mgnify:CR=1 FL=1
MATQVKTGKVRASFVHVFEPQSINGSEPKYSCSLIIPKSDTVTIGKIREAVEQAKRNMEKAAAELDFQAAAKYRDEMWVLQQYLKVWKV